MFNSENTIFFFFFSVNKCVLDFSLTHSHAYLQVPTYISVCPKTHKSVQIVAYAIKILECGNKYEKLSCVIPYSSISSVHGSRMIKFCFIIIYYSFILLSSISYIKKNRVVERNRSDAIKSSIYNCNCQLFL